MLWGRAVAAITLRREPKNDRHDRSPVAAPRAAIVAVVVRRDRPAAKAGAAPAAGADRDRHLLRTLRLQPAQSAGHARRAIGNPRRPLPGMRPLPRGRAGDVGGV